MDIEGSQGTAWQEGSYPPYVARMAMLNRQKLGVVLLSNSQEAQRLVVDTTTRALKLMLTAKYGIKENLEKPKPLVPKAVPWTQETLESYTGLYSAFGQATPITHNGDHLSGKFFDLQFDLIPISDRFLMPRFTFLFLFPVDFPQFPLELTEVDGKTIAVLRGLPFPVPLEKITLSEIPESWRSRLGTYVADNPDSQIEITDISLQVKDGLLTVVSKLNIKPFDFKEDHLSTGLLPISDVDAVIAGLFWGDGGTLHAVEEDGLTRIYYSGLWFTKKEEPLASPRPGPTP